MFSKTFAATSFSVLLVLLQQQHASAFVVQTPPATSSTALFMGGEVTPKTIKALRDATGAGMMDCKAALLESDGDQEAAAEYLRAKVCVRPGVVMPGSFLVEKKTCSTFVRCTTKWKIPLVFDSYVLCVCSQFIMVMTCHAITHNVDYTPTVCFLCVCAGFGQG